MPDELSPAHNNLVGQFGLELAWMPDEFSPAHNNLVGQLEDRQRIHFERGTQNVEATPKHRANPYRPGAWLLTPDTEATLNRRAALIISPVDPVDRCTALCRSHRRLKHRAEPRLPRGASASGVTGTKF
ncbi:unnamed protein product [Pleuronectes platessa]|uniref:Uncharacterized protein n=1 Tax=Pleuronectes platessa TaxID=8262 RepID=A0A9N7TNA0_PLEPL|nr:unnamed protein product [Pleuronectes platessa]